MPNCSKCKAEKPETEFGKDAAQASGRKSRCRECRLGEKAAARIGHAPEHDMTHVVPEGFHVKGTSTYYDRDGKVRSQWVKSQIDQEHQIEALMEAMRTLAEPYTGLADPAAVPGALDEDLLAVYPFGDPHFGMQSWAAETGESFDLKIAERDLFTAVDHLVTLAPPAKRALIVSLGDMFHADSNRGETTGGTRVDTDTRWSKILGVGIRAVRRCIDRALEKHEHVTFVPVCGNHDSHTSLMLGICLAGFYEREPRVTINTSPARFHYYRFGENLLGMTHGDMTKPSDLPGIMAVDRKEDWGQTSHRWWLCGHVHHESVKEYIGATVETFRTLAPKDAWHASKGYRSGQDLRLEILHRTDGPSQSFVVGLKKIRRVQK